MQNGDKQGGRKFKVGGNVGPQDGEDCSFQGTETRPAALEHGERVECDVK